MLILGDRVFESTLGEGDRVSLRETTLEGGGQGEFGGNLKGPPPHCGAFS